jgi:DNA mismatch repair protein MutS2
MLNKLENEKTKYEQLVLELQKKERIVQQRMTEYNQLKETIDNNKKQYIQQAKTEAKSLLDEVNKKIEATIRNIKETKADKEVTKQARAELEVLKAKVKPEKTVVPAQDIKVVGGDIQVGDFVRLKDNGAVAEVLGLKKKEVELSIGELKSTVKLNRLEKISSSGMKKEKKAFAKRTGYDSNAKMMDFSSNLDLRGKRGEEILPIIQNFIDEGYMLGMKDLRIVHGKGDGILREISRNILRNMDQVTKMEDEHADRGGSGVTLVALR